jgi:hypothetical protein
MDPDPTFHFDLDPNPTLKFGANPDFASYESDANSATPGLNYFEPPQLLNVDFFLPWSFLYMR